MIETATKSDISALMIELRAIKTRQSISCDRLMEVINRLGLITENMDYPVGTTFKYYGDKNKREYTIADYHVTRNIKGDIVGSVYIAVSDVAGQLVPKEFPLSSVVRSILKE